MAASKQFQFRLSAEGWNTFAADLRAVEAGAMSAEAAVKKMAAASPQLASSFDQAQGKVAQLTESFRGAGAGMGQFGGLLVRGGAVGIGLEVGRQALEKLQTAFTAIKEGIPAAGDAFKQVTARLQNVTDNASLTAAAYQRLMNVAAQTGTSVQDSVGAFTRFSVAAKDIGATSQQVLDLVAGIQKFGVVSGVSGQEAASATTQLAQALASGKFQGDELRSVMENMPQLAQALARELGVGVGQLRQMGADGKLTADVVFPALLRAVSDVDSRFQQMPVTTERAWSAVKVAMDNLLAQADAYLGLSGRIASQWQSTANLINAVQRTALPTAQQSADAAVVAAQSRVRALEAQITTSQDLRTAGVGQLASPEDRRLDTTSLQRDLDAAKRDLVEAQRQKSYLDSAAIQAAADEADQADRRRIQATKDRAKTEYETWQEKNDKIVAAQKEHSANLKRIQDAQDAGLISSEKAAADRATEFRRYVEAMQAGAEAPEKSGTKQEGESWEDVQRKIDGWRDKQQKAAEDVRNAIDPASAALARLNDQYNKLLEAEALFASSGGERGISPEEAANLRTRAFDNYTKAIENAGDKAGSTSRAFDQFFSRAASGFEDAIVKGKSFGDVIKGLEGDIARLILRTTVLDPLSSGISGFLKDSGGASGLLKSGWNWLTSLFADGGIMTSSGPMPLRRYAGGGIATSPQLAMFGEGSTPEAYVPLPDGRRIPVAMQGGAGSHYAPTISVSVASSNASPQQIAATVELAVRRSQAEFIAQINRGGAFAKAVGRRR